MTIFITPVNVPEFEHTIKPLKSNSLPSIDGISAKVLKEIISNVVVPKLCKLNNEQIQRNKYSDVLHGTNIISISYKENGGK